MTICDDNARTRSRENPRGASMLAAYGDYELWNPQCPPRDERALISNHIPVGRKDFHPAIGGPVILPGDAAQRLAQHDGMIAGRRRDRRGAAASAGGSQRC